MGATVRWRGFGSVWRGFGGNAPQVGVGDFDAAIDGEGDACAAIEGFVEGAHEGAAPPLFTQLPVKVKVARSARLPCRRR